MDKHIPSAMFLCLFFLVGCRTVPLPSPLPQGVQTIMGTIQPAELSLVRRGTHALLDTGAIVVYLESSTANLRVYEGKKVTLRGVHERNTDSSDQPVFVVESVVDVEEVTRDWDLQTLGIRLKVPRYWISVLEGESVHFLESGSTFPVISLSEEEGEILREGSSIMIDGKPATRVIDEVSGQQTISILRDHRILTILFTPRDREDPERLRSDWLDILHSISLQSSSSSASSRTMGTGSMLTPCGGSAGILCPKSMYCEIIDFEENIGMCRFL